MKLNLAAGIALLVMIQMPNREQAQHWANLASRVGGTPEQLADAWATWDESHEPVAVTQ